MKKLLAVILVAVMMVTVLAGCCSHVWFAATCTAPQTCQECGETEGEALGHTWVEATCEVAKTCSVCKETEGEALGHDWEEATTEAPKTCKTCAKTEGEKIVTDPRFTTEATKHIQGKWSCEIVLTGEMLGTTGYLDEVPCTVFYEFKNDGELLAVVEIHDRFAFLEGFKAYTVDLTYAAMASEGYSKSQADAAFLEVYGMDVKAYVDNQVNNMDLDELFEAFAEDGVYYITDNNIWFAQSWSNEFESSPYTLEDGVLIIEEDTLEEGGDPLKWTRVTE